MVGLLIRIGKCWLVTVTKGCVSRYCFILAEYRILEFLISLSNLSFLKRKYGNTEEVSGFFVSRKSVNFSDDGCGVLCLY